MNDFYRLNAGNTFDDSKFAYCEPTDDAEYVDDISRPKCPKCGGGLSSLYWVEPRKVILSKPKYGDFVYGMAHFLYSWRSL